jgi:hypothetical protein
MRDWFFDEFDCTERWGYRVLHALHEYPKRAFCWLFGHDIDAVQDSSNGEWDEFCVRCGDEGEFDCFTLGCLNWWISDHIAYPISCWYDREIGTSV